MTIDTLGRQRRVTRPSEDQPTLKITCARYFEQPKGRAPVTKHDGAKRAGLKVTAEEREE